VIVQQQFPEGRKTYHCARVSEPPARNYCASATSCQFGCPFRNRLFFMFNSMTCPLFCAPT
jgi:hypothetical protein